MTVPKGETSPLRRIILATDGSPASAKALSFVLAKFQPDRSTGKARQPTIHVSVVHVMARQRLAPSTMKMTGPWIKSEKRMKDVARRLGEHSTQQLIQAGFAAESVFKTGNPSEGIMKAASKQ
jgi:hypothetical protein